VQVTTAQVDALAKTLPMDGLNSEHMTLRAWQAFIDERHTEALAYTRECITRWSDEARRMNDAMTGYADSREAATLWALNDVGTCYFIMAETYAKLGMYPEATRAHETLARDFEYSQCWDPKGWYWRPAEVAREKLDDYRYQR